MIKQFSVEIPTASGKVEVNFLAETLQEAIEKAAERGGDASTIKNKGAAA